MTNTLVFQVNGTSFADILNDSNYETGMEPVFHSYEDLDKVTHARLIRWKHTLSVKVLPTNVNRVKSLMDALKNAPCQITYYSNQDRASVTKTMLPDSNSVIYGWNDYDHAFDLSFTEC